MVVLVMPYKILAYGESDVGLVRENNEDVWEEVPKLRFYALADGMGGHRAGEIAAKQAASGLCTLIKKKFGRRKHPGLNEMRGALQEAIDQVNEIIFKLSRDDEHLKGMGTTLCCIYFHEQGAVYGHVGDSRIYRLRDKKLEQLTSDHSLLRELKDLGQFYEQYIPEYLYKNIITKAIGTESVVEPSIHVCDVKSGDIFLMCSDGLTDMLSNDDIQAVLISTASPEEAAKLLIAKANDNGGNDNVTVVIMRVEGNQSVNEPKDLFR